MERINQWISVGALLFWMFSAPALAESQGEQYPGVTDPFGDPKNYEFSEDEREDKEFFHLGRYLMLGFDAGVGIFTGQLGTNTGPGFYLGARLIYFFDTNIAMEAAVHYSNHLQEIIPSSASILAIDTNLIPVNIGFRYYFDTRSAPRAIAIANPYLSFGGGAYIRQQTVIQQTADFTVGTSDNTASAFGGYAGFGVEFKISSHIYFGLDLRYHLIFFADEAEQFASPGDRSGDFFGGASTISYNF